MKSYKKMAEELKGKQHKIDKNKNGKIDAHDFKLLRKEDTNESFEFNRAALAKQRLMNLRKSGRSVRGASIANLMRAAGIREEELTDEDIGQLDEVLSKDAAAGDWIKDFVHSTNPKFEGKSKKERINMALGAYYAKQRNEEVETDTSEKNEMAETQLHFIKYAAEEILEYIKMGGEVEEWYQVKVAKSFSEFESLHSFIEGEKRRTGMVKEETIHVGHRNSKGDWIKTSAHSNYSDADKAMKDLKAQGKKGVQHRYDNKGNIDPGMKKLTHEEVEQIDEISSELAGKVSDTRFKKLMSMDRNDPKRPEASAKFSRASTSSIKRITRDMIKDPEKANKGFASDADKNTKRGWSNEEFELEEAKIGKPVNVDKIHSAGQEPHEEKFETYKKKTVKEEFDEDGNITYAKISFKDFTETILEGRAQYMVKATHNTTGRTKVTTYVADKEETQSDVHSRAQRDHKPSGFSIDSIRRKDVEAHGEGDEEETSSTTQKRGRGRPAGAKSGARGPRIK
jgi:hypothetical protein